MQFLIFVAFLTRGKIAASIMPAILTATISRNAKKLLQKIKKLNFSRQHFQDCKLAKASQLGFTDTEFYPEPLSFAAKWRARTM